MLLSPFGLGFLDQQLLMVIFSFLFGSLGLAGQGTLVQEAIKETADKGGVAQNLSSENTVNVRQANYVYQS